MLPQTTLQLGRGGNNLLVYDSKHFCQVSIKNRYFCKESQKVLSEVVATKSEEGIVHVKKALGEKFEVKDMAELHHFLSDRSVMEFC